MSYNTQETSEIRVYENRSERELGKKDMKLAFLDKITMFFAFTRKISPCKDGNYTSWKDDFSCGFTTLYLVVSLPRTKWESK